MKVLVFSKGDPLFSPSVELLPDELHPAGRGPAALLVSQLPRSPGARQEARGVRLRRRALLAELPPPGGPRGDGAGADGAAEAAVPHRPPAVRRSTGSKPPLWEELLKCVCVRNIGGCDLYI